MSERAEKSLVEDFATSEGSLDEERLTAERRALSRTVFLPDMVVG